MTESTVFFLVRIAAFLAVCFFQYAGWREFTRHPVRTFRARTSLAVLFILMNLPGLYVVFFGWYPMDGWLLRPVMSVYTLWIAGTVLLTVIRWAIRAVDRARNDPGPGASRASTDTGATRDVPAAPGDGYDSGRRAFLRESIAGITVFSFGGLIPNVPDSDDFEVVHQTIRLPNLSAKHHGLRIGVMADIHSGPFMKPDELVPYFDALRQIKADMIFLPGDFVQNRNEEVVPVCEQVRTLRASHGIFGVTGNHEYFADAEYIARELQQAGVTMLRNEHRIVTPNGERLAIIGVDDVRRGHPFDYLLAKAVKGLDSSIPNILLCHKPYYFDEAVEWGINLMVSGHTHGGQVVLARIFNTVITPAALVSGYIAGLYTRDSSQLYVTRGIGTVGLPYRLNCPPEITVLTLSA